MKTKLDVCLLETAILGLEAKGRKIEEKIAEIRRLLGVTPHVDPPKQAFQPKRILSEEARKRIAAAQRKRWREFRTKQRGS
jgi:hypothetical protein